MGTRAEGLRGLVRHGAIMAGVPSGRAQLTLLAAAGALALALIGVLLALDSGGGSSQSGRASGSQPSGFDGAVLAAPAPLRPFALTDQSGRRVSLADYRGQVTVLSFTSTACGPPCILVAQQVRGALDELPRPVPVLLISADPATDSAARVSRFLAAVALSGRARYLTGSPATLRAVWNAYGITPASVSRARFDRSLAVLLLDRDGRERDIFGLEQLTPEGLAHDVRKLEG